MLVKVLEFFDNYMAVLAWPFTMSRGAIGTRTGGKGSWRRKTKKVAKGGNQEGEKLWMTCLRQGCREFGELDTASIILKDSEEALGFTKPELSFNMHANTYVLKGTPEKKPLAEVFTDLLSSMDLSKFTKKADAEGDDLGEVPENVDFSNPKDGEEKPTD